jgi:hypothetical protein
MSAQRIELFAERQPSGEVCAVWLCSHENDLWLRDDRLPHEGSLALPAGALEAVLARYAKELEPQVKRETVATLSLAGASLERFRFMHFGDVYKTDWLLWESPGAASLAAPCPLCAAALLALARRYAQTQAGKGLNEALAAKQAAPQTETNAPDDLSTDSDA